MTENRTSREHEHTISALASEAFKKHELRVDHRDRIWHCGTPDGSSIYLFRLWFAPGMVVVWGDIGEYVFRVNDRDSLSWFMTAGSRDYVLGKVTASDGPRKEFHVGDARAHLKQWKADIVGEIQGELDEEPVEEGFERLPVNPDDAADASYNDPRLAAWRAVVDNFNDLLEDEELDPKTCWALAHYRAGDSEWPPCEGWTSSLLWLWEAILTFRRLHRVAYLVDCIHAKRRQISDAGDRHDAARCEVLEAELAALEAEHAKARAEATGGTPVVPVVPDGGGSPAGAVGGPQPGGGDADGSSSVPG